MSEIAEPIPQVAEAPVADTSQADLVAAFASATPYNSNAEPAPVATAPVPAPAPVEATNPAPVAVAPESVAPTAAPVDYAAWLKEQELPGDVAEIKAALATAREAQALKANQRTAQDVAFEKLLSDPAAATAFVKLQSTDFTAMPAKELLAAKYALDHPELSPEVAAIRARREYDAEYAAADFDDPDDPAVQEAKVLLNAATQQAIKTMEVAKNAAKEAVLTAAAPKAEGPSEAEVQAETQRAANWVQGVDGIVNAPSLELEYQVDGQTLKLAFDHQTPAFKEAMLDPNKWFFDQICPGGDVSKPNLDRLAEIVALTMQPDVLLKNAIATGKASLGAVISLDKTVNPAPNAPQGPASEMSLLDAFRQSVSANQSRNNSY